MTPAPPIATPDELRVESRVVVGPSEENDGRQRAQNAGESLWSRFRRTLLTHASRVAVCDSGSDYSYEELFRLTANLARFLLDAPVTLATPAPLTFGLLADEGLLVPVAKLAACAINAIVVPLDPTYPVERLVDMTRDCRLLVCDDRYAQVADRLFQKAATGCAAETTSNLRDPCIMVGIGRSAEACRAGLWSARNLTRLAKLLTADEKAAAEEERADDHEEVRFFSLNAAAGEDDQKRLREASPTARDPIPLYLVYTSGSSGTPKAVLGTQFSLSRYLFDNSPVLQRFPGDRVLLCSAVTWDPSFSDVYGTLLSGATLVLAPRARLVSDLRGCIEDYNVSHVLATPALWKLLDVGGPPAAEKEEVHALALAKNKSAAEQSCAEVCPTLRMLLLGGESWRKEELFLPRALTELYNIYGVTEATVYQAVSGNLLLDLVDVQEGASTTGFHAKSEGCGGRPQRGHAVERGRDLLHPLRLPSRFEHDGAPVPPRRTATVGLCFEQHEDWRHEDRRLEPSGEYAYGETRKRVRIYQGELCVYGDQVLSYSCANPVCRPSAEDQTRFYRVSGATFEAMPGFRTGDRAELHVLGEETPEAVAVQHEDAKFRGNSCHSYFVFEASRVIGFRVLDRMDRQVKLNGFRVELGEVESCLEEVASGCVCAKVEVPTETTTGGGSSRGILVAFFFEESRCACREVVDGQTPTAAHEARVSSQDFAIALRAFCESKLPRHAVPHRFVELEGPMPLTTSGKVDRKRVVAENLERATGRDSELEQVEKNRVTPANHEQLLHSIPTTATEKRLVALWSELLAQPPSTIKIDLRSHFFECGGTSATAVQMVRRLEEERSALNPEGRAASLAKWRNASSGTSMKTNGHKAKTGEEAAENAEMLHRKLCGLLRKPRLREYASFLDWADATSSTDQTSAPAASTSTESELLYTCLRVGDEKCLSLLLQSGAVDANGGFSKSFRGVTTPLLYILERSYRKDGEGERLVVDERRRKRLVESLIEHGADWTLGDAANRTPFHLLARIPFATCAFVRGCFDSVLHRGEYPLSAGEGGPGPSPSGSTSTGASSTAAIREHAKTLLLMPKDANKWNVLFYAVAAGNLALVETLFKWSSSSSRDDCPAKIRQGLFRLDAVDRWGKSVLHYAVENGDLGMTEFLLGFETTPLNYKPQQRAHRRRNDVLEYLPPLHTAVRKKDKKLLRLLLDSGAEVALNRDDQGRTALHEACAPALFFAVTRSGKEGNDDPPEPAEPGGVPAHSFDEDSLEILEMLLKSSAAGADETTGAPSFIDAVDRELRSALFYLVPDDGIMIKRATELLLAQRARVNLHDRLGRNYLEYHAAVLSAGTREREAEAHMHRNFRTTKVDDLASDTLEQPEADAEDHSELPLVRHEIERCDQQRQSKGRFGVAVDIRQEDHRQKKERSKKNQCFRCLEYGHAWKECPNKPKCRVCGLEHETKEHWKMLIAS